MGKIIFILGGARSGKSSYATQLASRFKKRVAFVATCPRLDEEMKRRIEIHKKSRPSYWQTFEETEDITSVLKKLNHRFYVILIDCLSLLVSNLLLKGLSETVIEGRIKNAFKILKRHNGVSIIVSNEVGLGIVPGNKLARGFRDLAGRVNQLVAEEASEVFFMISGIPLKIKGGNRCTR
jgi:adenosylcobinamide kinase/adenosylcobinamide-phosphate guanylyltransferase